MIVAFPAHAAVNESEAVVLDWSISNGSTSIRWNRELLDELGIRVGGPVSFDARLGQIGASAIVPSQVGALVLRLHQGKLVSFGAGQLKGHGGPRIRVGDNDIDLVDFRLLGGAESSTELDLIGSDGQSWFRLVRPMYEFSDDRRSLLISTMDLTISPELASLVGRPETAGWTVGDVTINATTTALPAPASPTATFNWPGDPAPDGGVYQVDLFMKSMIFQYLRCDFCSGPGGSGRVVFTPSSTLINNTNKGSVFSTVPNDPLGQSSARWAAGVAWYSKFSGTFAPYQNDQHPYLIWNMYRIAADGSIRQIGRSGAKHAFLTTNRNCLDEDDHDFHVLGRGCEDTYTLSHNDTSDALGPRSEIIPSTGQWGRCFSVYDPLCNVVATSPGYGSYDQRMVVRESQFSGPGMSGSSYLFESWYVARDDINIYNSMATVVVVPTYSNGWNVNGQSQYRLGPAIDRWMNPLAPGSNAANVEIVTAEGRIKVAGKARFSIINNWRYDYAFANMDFSRPDVDGVEPNLHVKSNEGIREIRIPIGNQTISGVTFLDADTDPANDWVISQSDGWLVFTAPEGNRLDWGSLYSAFFYSDSAPITSNLTLTVAKPGSPTSVYATGLPAPADRLFQHGFDEP